MLSSLCAHSEHAIRHAMYTLCKHSKHEMLHSKHAMYEYRRKIPSAETCYGPKRSGHAWLYNGDVRGLARLQFVVNLGVDVHQA
jgi:hypothetical protein